MSDAPQQRVFPWPNTRAPGLTDWVEFVMDPAEEDGYPRLFRINMSFMTSNWQCTFGSCPGILVTGALTDVSCCQIGVHFGLHEGPMDKWAEWERVNEAVQQLTPEDWDHGYGNEKHSDYWTVYQRRRYVNAVGASIVNGVPERTRVVKGGCIFANRHDGAAGKPGCAFHHLAARTGRHHSETKPDICWMIPFAISPPTYDDDFMMDVVTVTGTTASMWGSHDTEGTETPGHWCTEIPDHYTGVDPVYKYAEIELRKMMGDAEYERMVEVIKAAGPRRWPMPGEVVANGRKILPLLVENRKKQWEAEGKARQVKTAEDWLGNQS